MRITANLDRIGSVLRVYSNLCSRLLRCLLVIAAWQAPLPFCHNHGTLGNATKDSPFWLAEHLRTHHTSIDPSSSSVFGWHVHFALPEPGEESSNEPNPPRQQCVLATSGLSSWDGFARLQPPSAPGTCHDFAVASSDAHVNHVCSAFRHSGGFFTEFAPDMPLPVRLGVLRC
jgi:hypothetical protein